MSARSTPLGRPRLHLREVDSTNVRARKLAAVGAPHGALVTADRQTAGRGRRGRRWEAPAGRAVLMSLVLREDGDHRPLLPLAAAVAVSDACERVAAVRCQIKWPNDVWIDRRKVAGILVEGRPQEAWRVLGIGINVATEETEFPEELRGLATSLAIAAGSADRAPASVEAVVASALDSLARWLDEPAEAVAEAWRARDALRGERVRWSGGEGVAEGITHAGALLVATERGQVALDAGGVHLGRSPRGDG